MDTWLGTKNKVKAVTKDDFYITLNKKDVRNLKISLEYKGPIKVYEEGDEVAKLLIYNKDETIKTYHFMRMRKYQK